MNNKKDKQTTKEEVSSQIFGEPIEDTELADGEIVQSDEALTSLNPDEDYTKEAVSGFTDSLNDSKEFTDRSPNLTSNDIDADWQEATASEETSLAENPTPDQDQVDAVSEPWGTDYSDDEELDIKRKARVLEQEREDDENKKEE